MDVMDTTPRGVAVELSTLPLILLIEDNPDDAKLLKEAFLERGIAVRFMTVATPTQAFSVLRLLPSTVLPRLILIDIGLPIMSGHEILSNFAKEPNWHLIPKIVLTSSQRESDRILSLERGACGHVVKPAVFEEYLALATKLSRYVSA
jgi:CheY-like chemotaxis protein